MKVAGILLTVELLFTVEAWILVLFGLVGKVGTAKSQCLCIKPYELSCKAAI